MQFFFPASLEIAKCVVLPYVSLACTVVEAATWFGEFIEFGVVGLGFCTGEGFRVAAYGLWLLRAGG